MSSDPHTGGDLSDMAVKGTTMPNDAGEQRTIPSVPRPGQGDELGAPDLAGAADNQTDIARQTADRGATGEVITGTGDALPGNVEAKRLAPTAGNPAAKGHPRDEKNMKSTSDVERFAGEGPEMDEQVEGATKGVK